MQPSGLTSKLRTDYLPPSFFISHVDLTFDLEEETTRVTSILTVMRNGEHDLPLVLDGEDLTLLSAELDGREVTQLQLDKNSLTIDTHAQAFTLKIVNQINPKANSSLEGLYLSAGAFCTQCEAEGFRKITYFLDRPDVLSKYDVKIIADQKAFPFLLSNGNKIDQGQLENGKHWVSWSDPFNKPCYLFALVAGDFDLLSDTFTTQSNRQVALELYVDKGMSNRGHHALESLKKSMAWDEQEFGLEYDLDIYMIVAVDFFNMGAMENKGLNVFNSKYVLANGDTATDEDYFNIEAVIGHEYFHNWTGNRVTCRDWFQLSLKEGLTVFRDQQFSADMSSPVVNRIKNVKIIREHQFAEDAGPMAHPIRPDEVMEMNNFYTVTVYDKGAEVIRMLHTLLGKAGFRAGMDLYFQRFDGQAVTCDDFVQAMQDANDKDLSVFKRWYSQSGTPVVSVTEQFDPQTQTYELTFAQSTPPTYSQQDKQDLLIPISLSLLDESGKAFSLDKQQSSSLLELSTSSQTVTAEGFASKPLPSLLHNFSAPVKVEFDYSHQDLQRLVSHSPDPFTRWDAAQRLFSQCIHELDSLTHAQQQERLNQTLAVFAEVLADDSLALDFKAEMLTQPSFETLFQQHAQIDVDGIVASRKRVADALSQTYAEQWLTLYQGIEIGPYQYANQQVKQRRLRNLALKHLAAAGQFELVEQHYQQADNMTDTLGALMAAQAGELSGFDQLMHRFEEKWRGDVLVLDKWFALHAKTGRKDILGVLTMLMGHSQFSMSNPNRVRSVLGSFAFYNVEGFHHKDGSGYQFVADNLIKLDSINPQVASRIITPLIQWQKVDLDRQALMQRQLARIGDTKGLSKDLYEKISKSLG